MRLPKMDRRDILNLRRPAREGIGTDREEGLMVRMVEAQKAGEAITKKGGFMNRKQNDNLHSSNEMQNMRNEQQQNNMHEQENMSSSREQENMRNTNTEAEKTQAANAGRSASDQMSENSSPSRGEIRGTPGVSRGASDNAGTAGGLKPKMGVTGTDSDGQVAD